jgi:hypothetical protein
VTTKTTTLRSSGELRRFWPDDFLTSRQTIFLTDKEVSRVPNFELFDRFNLKITDNEFFKTFFGGHIFFIISNRFVPLDV